MVAIVRSQTSRRKYPEMTRLTNRVIYLVIILALIGRSTWHLVSKSPNATNENLQTLHRSSVALCILRSPSRRTPVSHVRRGFIISIHSIMSDLIQMMDQRFPSTASGSREPSARSLSCLKMICLLLS
jgi:hypothetical protein